MYKALKFFASTAIATSLMTGAVMAGSPIIGDYYDGIDSNAPRGALRQQTKVDLFTTGSIESRGGKHRSPAIKGGEGEYYPGIQRN
ncbi:hypothetical protein HT585_28920 [Ensifer sp. HO-A22]|uniref:Uncharacterized protein n=1 Tax=Ensifer oleiphilus TaxID=2742698 RepID=A0A7Y6QCK5_9HYPH|nr:hypothetical protein [Ensifer oleiphilus]NVD42895.1 hypothetical protein [Ensifer oleiphilus]